MLFKKQKKIDELLYKLTQQDKRIKEEQDMYMQLKARYILLDNELNELKRSLNPSMTELFKHPVCPQNIVEKIKEIKEKIKPRKVPKTSVIDNDTKYVNISEQHQILVFTEEFEQKIKQSSLPLPVFFYEPYGNSNYTVGAMQLVSMHGMSDNCGIPDTLRIVNHIAGKEPYLLVYKLENSPCKK